MQTFSATFNVWLGTPANLVRLDPDSPYDFQSYTTMFNPSFRGEEYSYLKLGTAVVTYSVDLTDPSIKAAALKEIEDKMKIEQENFASRMAVLQAAANSLLAIEYKA